MRNFSIGDLVRRTEFTKYGLAVGDVRAVSWVSIGGAHISLVPLPGDTWKLDFRFDAAKFEHVEHNQAASRKDDSGKLDMTLMDDMPRAIKAVVEVMQWAVTKKLPTPYARGSWQGVHADRYRAAMGRHNLSACVQSSAPGAAASRFQRDAETDLLHLAHSACSALMALENTIRELEENKDATT